MFRSRWGALIFVVLSAASAASLIGREDDEGVLIDAAEEIQQQRGAMEQAASGGPTPAPIAADEPLGFSEDEELIDDAQGFDPSPADDSAAPAAELVPYDEVIIISRDVGGAQEQ